MMRPDWELLRSVGRFGVSDEKLKVDLEALGKLSPELRGYAKKLTDKASNPPKVEAGDTPSMQALQRLAMQVMPDLQRAFAGRCTNVADVSVQAKNGFANTDDDLRKLIESVSGLSRGSR